MRKAAVFLAALAFTNAASAASITHRMTPEGRAVIELNGEIREGDSAAVKDIIRSYNAGGVKVSGIRLNSMGGSLREGYLTADIIERAGLDTVVGPRKVCASACVVLFIAGRHKWANTTSTIAVHSVSIRGVENDESQAATARMARIFKSHGAPDSVLGKMVGTGAGSATPVTIGELEQMGVTVLGNYAGNY
jgi:hypothetical protein